MYGRTEEIGFLQTLIADAEKRIGSYVAALPVEAYGYDPYIQKQSAKIMAWAQQIEKLLKAKEVR